jgi:hypothetical protein
MSSKKDHHKVAQVDKDKSISRKKGEEEPNPNHLEDFNEVLRKAAPPIKPRQT